MNARLRVLQRRGKVGVVVFTVLSVGALACVALGFDFLAWCIAPLVSGVLAFTFRTVAMITRLRAQLDREADERAEKVARRERLRQELRTLKAPDAVDGQCPVCGFDDLDELAAVDEELEEPGSRFTRVVTYGARRAHQECAELVPYKKTPVELAVEAHQLNHHGAQIARMIGCPLCGQETREQIANDPDVDRPIWPPLGVTYAELSERLTQVFRVPQADFGVAPLQLPELSEREVRTMFDHGLLDQTELRRLRLRIPPYPNEKGDPR